LPSSESNASKPLVLLVDDDEDSRFLYTHYLTSAAGLTVVEASNGREAIELANEMMPAVIVMDLTLPVMDGWEALRVLKGDPRTQGIPVVALTGHTLSSPGERGDFDAVLVKPCLPEVLAKHVRGLLEPGTP
jgi:CheY-like chemotaxis protein